LENLNYPTTDIKELKPTNKEKYLLTISMCVVGMHNAMLKWNQSNEKVKNKPPSQSTSKGDQPSPKQKA